MLMNHQAVHHTREFPYRLNFYAHASAWCVQGDLNRAQAALTLAYLAVPPATFTGDDERALLSIADDLVYVGQFLPSLRPTLELLGQLQNTCGHKMF